MKRCDNCGWYNSDARTTCEKCGERLGESIEAERPPQASDNPSAGFEPAHPLAQTEPKPQTEPRQRPARQSRWSATMRVTEGVLDSVKEEPAPGVCPKCHYPVAGNPETCPNCGAPLRRSTRKDASSAVRQEAPAPAPAPAPVQQPVQPQNNFGKATIRDPRAAMASAAPAPAPVQQPVQPQNNFGKATIRDARAAMPPAAPAPAPAPSPAPVQAQPAPAARPADEVFRLVPVTDPSAPILYMREGDLVIIDGKRYRFVK